MRKAGSVAGGRFPRCQRRRESQGEAWGGQTQASVRPHAGRTRFHDGGGRPAGQGDGLRGGVRGCWWRQARRQPATPPGPCAEAGWPRVRVGAATAGPGVQGLVHQDGTRYTSWSAKHHIARGSTRQGSRGAHGAWSGRPSRDLPGVDRMKRAAWEKKLLTRPLFSTATERNGKKSLLRGRHFFNNLNVELFDWRFKM